MKIGLIRHFKVTLPYPTKWLVSYDEVVDWFAKYEHGELDIFPIDLGDEEWHAGYTSAAPRAVKTAKAIPAISFISSEEIKELDLIPHLKSNVRLPFMVWATWVKIVSSSSHEEVTVFKNRIASFVDKIMETHIDQNVLIVSHGFVMMFMQKELKKRGFQGKGFSSPKNGVVYTFHN